MHLLLTPLACRSRLLRTQCNPLCSLSQNSLLQLNLTLRRCQKSSSSIPCGKGCHNNAVSHVCGIFLFLSPSFCIRQKRLWGGGDIISTAGEDEAEEVMTTIPWLMPKRELFSSSSGACVHYLSSFFFLRQQKERKILLLPCRLIFYPFLLL